MIHELKILPEYFEAVRDGRKPFEIRKNDRGFTVGDVVFLNEYKDGSYTKRCIVAEITYLIDDEAFCKEGFVVFGIKRLFSFRRLWGGAAR